MAAVAKPLKKPSRSVPSKSGKARPRASRKDPSVDLWFGRLDHPQKVLMLQVRRAILASDSRVTESVKWSTPTFSFNGDIASFIPQAKNFVSLLFHRGAEIPGRHPRLEGISRLARTMRFASTKDLKQNRSHLEKAIRAWCDDRSG